MEVMTETKPGFKQTKLGWIPNQWKVKSLGEVAKLRRGRFSPRPRNDPRFYNGDIPFVQTGDVTNSGGLIRTYSQTLNEDGLKVSILFKKGTILMTIAANIGHVGILDFAMACPDSLIGIECSPNVFNEFLNFSLRYQQPRIDYLAPAGAQKNINIEFLSPFKVLIPPLPEQKAIAACLGSWDKALDTLSQLIAQKEQCKKGLMQQLLTGKKRLPGFSGEWREEKLGDYFKERKESGYTDLPLLSVGEIGVYPQSEGNKKDTSNADKSKYKRICLGDIGYNTMRMWQGRNALSQLEGIISPAYTVLTPKKNADSKHFSYLFKLPEVVHKFFRNSQGLVSDTLNCKYKDFAIVKVALPPTIDEQIAISKALDKADTEIVLLGKKLDQLKQQKKGLMQQLLTGKKRLV